MSSCESSFQTSATVSRASSVIEAAPPRSTYRPSSEELDRARRSKQRQKKDEKKKAEAEATMRSVWNLDTEVCLDLDLEFRYADLLSFVLDLEIR